MSRSASCTTINGARESAGVAPRSGRRDGPNEADVAELYASAFATGYDLRATCWERLLSRRASAQFHARLLGLPRRPLDVLDIGCGTGRNLNRLHAAGVAVSDYRGIDGSRMMLEQARMNHPYTRAVFEEVDSLTSDAGRSFDLVLCTWVLSHLERPGELIDDARRQLKPGGRLLIAALTETAQPLGALLGWSYRHRLHADPISPEVLAGRHPHYVGRGLFGLTTVAEFRERQTT